MKEREGLGVISRRVTELESSRATGVVRVFDEGDESRGPAARATVVARVFDEGNWRCEGLRRG